MKKGKIKVGLTQKEIESLGFSFVLKDEELDCDYTFNKKSFKSGWVDCLVWQPKESKITISTHIENIADYINSSNIQKPRTMKEWDSIIKQKFDGTILSSGQLEDICKQNEIIK